MILPEAPGWDGPPDRTEPEMAECDFCDGTGHYLPTEHGPTKPCHICRGDGEVPAEAEEPDPDYERERRQDARWDNQ